MPKTGQMDAYTTNNIITPSFRDAPSTRQSFKVRLFLKEEIHSVVEAGFVKVFAPHRSFIAFVPTDNFLD